MRVAAAVLPNGRPAGSRGRRSAATTSSTRGWSSTARALTATLLRDGRPVFRAPVGIGRAAAPTPARRRSTSATGSPAIASPIYGPLAFGTSARSPTLTDWPAGGFVGIHGTDRPDLVPGRVSHGCIRMRNADILRLARG